MRDVAINRIMTTNPATIGPDEPVGAAKALLERGDINHLPVVENGRLAGILSSSDLLKLYLLDGGVAALADADAAVRQIMEPNPVVLESRASLRDAANTLSVGGYHALPVVETDRTLVGIVTTSDLVDHLLLQIPRGDGSLRPQPRSEPLTGLSESEISAVLREAEQTLEQGEELSKLAKVLLHFRDRNRLLNFACQAAELYIRSGHAEHEHSVLVKRLADLQKSSSVIA